MSGVETSFQTIVRRLVGADGGEALCGISARQLAETSGDDPVAGLARTTGAFLLSLCGGSAAETARAGLAGDAADASSFVGFLGRLSTRVLAEQESLPLSGGALASRRTAADWAGRSPAEPWGIGAQQAIWGFLFPEGAACLDDPDGAAAMLRQRRAVQIDELNPQPIVDPIRELLLTANILLTLPSDQSAIDELPVSASLRERVREIAEEHQQYWFDHPIPLGIETDANEIIYGLKGLNEAVAFEKDSGQAAADARLACVLSVSVTHSGLQRVARDYLQEAFAAAPDMPHLDVYVFSQAAIDRLIDQVLAPAIAQYLGRNDIESLRHVLGVDGEYGRHYSFLKAVSALWHVLVDRQVRATFKIDLDQVFPQERLVAEGGGTAFEHLRTPLWGARGRDAFGREIELGMLAGALVNEKDIGRGLFTPDVVPPTSIPAGEAVTFFSRLPMAVSTEAEMMMRYTESAGHPDGRTTCLHRIHVTGGTNGILVDALRRHRPFTPTFIGRAEDQAYLLSVLFAGSPALRYVHSAGLIMRHDKEAFAGSAIEAAKAGRFVGDLVRTLHFSHYVRALPWPETEVKREIDPFTGCFASQVPVTVVALRLALRVGELLSAGGDASRAEALELMELAAERLDPLIAELTDSPQILAGQLADERTGWDLLYDALDALELALHEYDPEAIALRDAARKVVNDCRVNTAGGAAAASLESPPRSE